ncbi:hypothetical protein FJZ19_04465 [Candidatus Pacearchaeota archaeon]|nr:hypothetical protein [Candidatus Pacearchaeota archaeon]
MAKPERRLYWQRILQNGSYVWLFLAVNVTTNIDILRSRIFRVFEPEHTEEDLMGDHFVGTPFNYEFFRVVSGRRDIDLHRVYRREVVSCEKLEKLASASGPDEFNRTLREIIYF